MTSPNSLASGGNVQAPDDKISVLGYSYVNAQGPPAAVMHRYIKLARREGVILKSGAYEYSRRSRHLTMLNAKFQGPLDAVEALKKAIDSLKT